jgi:RNA polymerase sigma factor (sigma-70 family)
VQGRVRKRPAFSSRVDAGIFPTTIWSEVRRGGARAEGRDAALEALARRYQGPAEAWLRAALGLRREEAHELFQEFFAWMLASDFLAKAERERGRFRAFLKVALRRFAIDEQRAAAASKRGGGERMESTDADGAPEPADGAQPTPEEALDRAWRAALVEEAFERTRRTLEGRERGLVFAVFRDHYLAPGPAADYRTLAARHGITTTDVSNHLQRAKALYRDELRALVLDTVATPADLGEELAWLVEEEA